VTDSGNNTSVLHRDMCNRYQQITKQSYD